MRTADSPSRKLDWFWIGLLWLVAVAVFWPVLAGGKTLWYRDTRAYYYPEGILTARAWLEGEIPLWEPRIGMGYPYHADPHSMIFYPLTAIFLLLPMPLAYNAFVAVHVPLMGCFTFLLLRRWRLSREASAAGAMSLMLCGFTMSCVSLTTLLRGLCWTPLTLYAFECWLQSGSPQSLMGAAWTLAVEGSGTDPNYVLYSWLLLALLPILRPLPLRVSRKRVAGGAFIAGATAFLLLSYQYLPLASLISRSDRFHIDPSEGSLFDIRPLNLYNLAVPTPFPDPRDATFFASFQDGDAPLLESVYFGVPVLTLAAAALGWALRSRATERDPETAPDEGKPEARSVVSLAILALLAVGVSLGDHLPLFKLLNWVCPPLRLFRFPAKYFFLTALTVPLLVSVGFEGISRRHPGCSRVWKLSTAIAALGLVAALIAIRSTGNEFPRLFLSRGGRNLAGDPAPFLASLGQTWCLVVSCALGLVALQAALVWFAERRKGSSRLASRLILGALVAGLLPAAQRSLICQDASLVCRTPEMVGTVEPTGHRSPPVRFVTYPLNEHEFGFSFTLATLDSVEDLLFSALRGGSWGYDSMLSLMSVRTPLENVLCLMMMDAPSRAARDRLAARCGASLVLSAEGLGNVTGTTPVIAKDGPVVARQLVSGPRAFLAPRADPGSLGECASASAAIELLPDRVVFDPAQRPAAPGSLVPTHIGPCHIESYHRNSVEISFELEGEGLLVLLDKYHPGWRAWVDGQERPVFQAGGVFRGVVVRQGEHRLRMQYQPWEFRVGAGVSLALAVLTIGLAWGRRRRAE